jgi:hypothetical protein
MTMSDKPATAADCRYRPSPRRFDLTQGSLVFINTCFAIAFGSIYTLIVEAFARDATQIDRWADIIWAAFAGYLVFTVWRQYSTYYIPLQFHSQAGETFLQEATTLLITVCLALTALCAAKKPEITPIFMILLIVLNVAKLEQMSATLRRKTSTQLAVSELAHFKKRLLIYLGILLGLTFVTWSFGEGWDRSTYAIVVASTAVVATVFTPVVYRRIFIETPVMPGQYARSIECAWADDV